MHSTSFTVGEKQDLERNDKDLGQNRSQVVDQGAAASVEDLKGRVPMNLFWIRGEKIAFACNIFFNLKVICWAIDVCTGNDY